MPGTGEDREMDRLEKYRGIIPAFYACYDKNGKISTDAVRDLTRYFIQKKVKGIYVNGSSGECIYQSVEERKRILEAVMKEAEGKLTVIAHVACNNTEDSMELAAHAESLGVDAVAAIPPIYFRLPEHAVAGYWNAISQAAPATDFVIYNIPQLAGTALTERLFRKMRENERVIGVKNSSMPIQDIQIFKAAGGADCVVFNGADEQFIGGKAIGADGGIGGTYGAMPELFLAMDELMEKGRTEDARRIQYEVNDIISCLCSGHGSMYGIIKEVLRIREGLDIGSVRSPLPELEGNDFEIAAKAACMIDEAVSGIQ